MKFDIPKHCYIRWQAALAVLEDLQDDPDTRLNMDQWGERNNWHNPKCGTSGCYAGWMASAPYCQALGIGYPRMIYRWLLDIDTPSDNDNWGYEKDPLFQQLFHWKLAKGNQEKTLQFLEQRLKSIFKKSTGKELVAPLTFYLPA